MNELKTPIFPTQVHVRQRVLPAFKDPNLDTIFKLFLRCVGQKIIGGSQVNSTVQ